MAQKRPVLAFTALGWVVVHPGKNKRSESLYSNHPSNVTPGAGEFTGIKLELCPRIMFLFENEWGWPLIGPALEFWGRLREVPTTHSKVQEYPQHQNASISLRNGPVSRFSSPGGTTYRFADLTRSESLYSNHRNSTSARRVVQANWSLFGGRSLGSWQHPHLMA